MNLHEHSQTHNWEMGIKFSKQFDYDIYDDVNKELSQLLSSSQSHTPNQQVQETKQNYQSNYSPKSSLKPVYKPKEPSNKGWLDKIIASVIGEEGYCIRCGKLS
jgi:hypothetical protein